MIVSRIDQIKKMGREIKEKENLRIQELEIRNKILMDKATDMVPRVVELIKAVNECKTAELPFCAKLMDERLSKPGMLMKMIPDKEGIALECRTSKCSIVFDKADMLSKYLIVVPNSITAKEWTGEMLNVFVSNYDEFESSIYSIIDFHLAKYEFEDVHISREQIRNGLETGVIRILEDDIGVIVVQFGENTNEELQYTFDCHCSLKEFFEIYTMDNVIEILYNGLSELKENSSSFEDWKYYKSVLDAMENEQNIER